MGCVSSAAVKVSMSKSRQRSPQNSSPNTPRFQDSGEIDFNVQRARSDFQKIMANVGWIPKPPNMVPVVCLSDEAVPLVVAPLCLEEGDKTNVSLPAMAATHLGPGRVVIIGQIQLLVQCTHSSTDASLFLENLIHWTCASTNSTRILLLDLPAHIVQFLQKNLAGYEYRVLAENDSHHITKVHVIICMSDCKYMNDLEVFLSRGGGLICCASENNENIFPMNDLLTKAGVAFPACPLAIGPMNMPTMKASQHYSEMAQFTLKSFAHSYLELIESDRQDIAELDNLITSLRYHVQCMNQGENELLCELFEKANIFLKKYNYRTDDGGICPDLIQNITAVLMVEIQSKLPAIFFEGTDESNPFPGQPDEITSEDVKINITTIPDEWVSTHYYIPPGVLGHVKVDDVSTLGNSITVQIGATTECLISKPSPWKRWPLTVAEYPLDKEEIDICSPFGGNIYIISNSTKPVTFEVTLTNVMQYPYWPSNWDIFATNTMPFVEIETKHTLVTVPTFKIRNSEDIPSFADRIDNLIDKVIEFFQDRHPKQFRVVFDVETPEEGPVCGYPIILHVDSYDEILNSEGPSCEMFSLAMFFAVLKMPDGALDADKEASIAHIAACATFIELWPEKSPMEYSTVILPSLFNKLWEIYEKHQKEFKSAFEKSIGDYNALLDKRGNPDLWAIFVQELSLRCNETFTGLIEKSKPITSGMGSMVMTMSSQSLQGYVISDDDEV